MSVKIKIFTVSNFQYGEEFYTCMHKASSLSEKQIGPLFAKHSWGILQFCTCFGLE